MFPRHAVIVTAAGSSSRFNEGGGIPSKKEFLKIEGRSILSKAVEPFLSVQGLVAVFITYKPRTENLTKAAVEDVNTGKVPFFFVPGGDTRQKSVFNALRELYSRNDELKVELVSIHDGARPFVSEYTVSDCIAYAKLFGGAVPGVSVRDTMVRVSEDGFIQSYVDRSGAYQIQTPQTFRFPDIFNCHVNAIRDNRNDFTDDTGIFTSYGNQVAVVSGSTENIKITYQSDIPDKGPDSEQDFDTEEENF